MVLLAVVVLAHPLLDAFTSYGTLLWWPFSDHRYAWDGIAIIDPFYTGPLLLALLAGRFRPALRPRLCGAALLATTLLLAHGVALDHRAEARVAAQLRAQGVTVSEVRAYPTLLQPWLRRVVARGPEGVQVGLISEFTGGPFVGSSFVPVTDPRTERLRASAEGDLFQWFSHGQTAARVVEEPPGYRVEIEDLRYGVPGPPDQGLWGIRARFDARGQRLGPVERFDRRPADTPALLRLLLRATFLPGN
jgi:inner membrane protein